MRNFTPIRDLYDLDTTRLTVSCSCGAVEQYYGLADFHAAGGEFAAESPLLVRCPACEQARPGSVTLASAETAANDSPASETPLTLTIALPEAPCPSCHHAVFADDITTGPEYPEVGWNHYVCSFCDTGIAPSSIKDADVDDIQPVGDEEQ